MSGPQEPGSSPDPTEASIPPLVPLPRPTRPAVPRPPVPFSVGGALSVGWQAFTGSYGPLVLAALILIGVNMGATVVGLVIPLADVLVYVLVIWPLTPGLAYVGILACRDGRVDSEKLFVGFQCYGRSLLLGLIMIAVSIGCVIPMAIAGVAVAVVIGAGLGTPVLIILPLAAGALISIAAVLYVTVRLGLAYGLIVDPGAGKLTATEAIVTSWRLTADLAMPLIGLYLVLVLIGIGSILLLCVGYLLIGVPLGVAVGGATYWLITGDFGRTMCMRCGYDLAGSVGARCPECGEVIGGAAELGVEA